eukprot:IDg18961t1
MTITCILPPLTTCLRPLGLHHSRAPNGMGHIPFHFSIVLCCLCLSMSAHRCITCLKSAAATKNSRVPECQRSIILHGFLIQ